MDPYYFPESNQKSSLASNVTLILKCIFFIIFVYITPLTLHFIPKVDILETDRTKEKSI